MTIATQVLIIRLVSFGNLIGNVIISVIFDVVFS